MKAVLTVRLGGGERGGWKGAGQEGAGWEGGRDERGKDGKGAGMKGGRMGGGREWKGAGWEGGGNERGQDGRGAGTGGGRINVSEWVGTHVSVHVCVRVKVPLKTQYHGTYVCNCETIAKCKVYARTQLLQPQSVYINTCTRMRQLNPIHPIENSLRSRNHVLKYNTYM